LNAAGLGDTVFTLGFPDPGLQGFAPKVLAHGHHGGNRVAHRRRDDARHFPAALSCYHTTVVLSARQNCWTVPGGIAGSAFWFGLVGNAKPKGGFPKYNEALPKQNKELTKYKVSVPKHNKSLTKYNEELAKQNKASPKQNKDLTKYNVSLPKHNKAFTKYNEELPKQNKRSK
jgi:hypothetical protein